MRRIRSSLYFFNKKERWGLTAMGWVAVGIIAVGVPIALLANIHGFLAAEERVKGDVLVVESWIPDFAIPGAIEEFKRDGYQRLVLVGAPILLGGDLSRFKSYSEFTYARLIALGFDKERIVVLETSDITKDRTYQSAVAVKRWLSLDHNVNRRGLNVYSLDVHSRRSRLLFTKALGDQFTVGVIAAPDRRYDPETWWKSSNGVRTVLDELIAYLYAAIFFLP
jgi:uncharacterized SAM-binding protein YcdF (DUF218 family)